MSFLSILGNIGKGLIGLGGGTNAGKVADAVMDRLGGLGKTAGDLASGSADQRLNELMAALAVGNQGLTAARDRHDADLSGEQARFGADLSGAQSKFNADLAGSNAQFGAGMQGAQFDREGQGREQKQQALMTLLGNTKDLKLTPGNPAIAAAMGSREGGARPSNLTTNNAGLLEALGKGQISAPTYSAPEAFKAPEPFRAPAPYQAPELPEMSDPGVLEKILGGVGVGGSILSAIGKFRPQITGWQDPNAQGGRAIGGAQY